MVGGVVADTEKAKPTGGAGQDLVASPPDRARHRGTTPVPFRAPRGGRWRGSERLARLERASGTAAATTPLPERGWYLRLGKPVLDRVGAVILGVVTLPIAAIVALVIRVTLGSSVLYVQERVGQHGRRFRMYKFRTMRVDRRRQQRPFPGADRRVRHKTPEDPRHTTVGRFLRRSSLDELPQLWNVALGHMSLVGPRPELPSVVAEYGPWQHARHIFKPGITGLWQISTRNIGDGSLMCEHTEVDLEYLRVVSLRTDLAILCRTLGVLRGGE